MTDETRRPLLGVRRYHAGRAKGLVLPGVPAGRRPGPLGKAASLLPLPRSHAAWARLPALSGVPAGLWRAPEAREPGEALQPVPGAPPGSLGRFGLLRLPQSRLPGAAAGPEGAVTCRECGKPESPGRWRGLCSTCRRSRCCRCGEALKPGRRNKRCAGCMSSYRDEGLAKEERACTRCGETLPEARRDHWCAWCRRSAYLERRLRLAARGAAVCSRCQAELPPGWEYRTCTRCQTEERQRGGRLARQFRSGWLG